MKQLQRIFLLLLSTLVLASGLLHPRQNSSLESNDTIDGIRWWESMYQALPGMEQRYKPKCWEMINDLLNKTSEYDKLASAASVSLLTLLPAFVAFSPVPIPRISNLMVLSPLAAFVVAGMTLGIPPAHSIEPSYRVLKARDLAPDELIASLGVSRSANGRTQHVGVSRRNAIHQWYTGNPNLTAIRRRVLQDETPCLGKRLSVGRSMLYSCLFFVTQIISVIILCFLSLAMMGSHIWTCTAVSGEYHSLWILLSFILATPLYGVTAIFCKDTAYTFYLSPLPKSLCLPSNDITGIANEVEEWEERRPFDFRFKFSASRRRICNKPKPIQRGFRQICRQRWEAFWLLMQSQTPSAIVIRRISETGGTAKPLCFSLIGTLRGFVLIILTFLYATSYGGTFHITAIFVFVFFAIISSSRILGTVLLSKLQDAANFTVIDCFSSSEVRGMMRLLTMMPGVVVSKRGCRLRFSGGLCIDDYYNDKRYVEQREQVHYLCVALPQCAVVAGLCVGIYVFFYGFLALMPVIIGQLLLAFYADIGLKNNWYLQENGAWRSILPENGIYITCADVDERTTLESVVVDDSSRIQ
ncbi:hypothetical protein BZA77DRAFT_329166 [Pyronema omphalodes]|nr:hypothetical protein BZA77DRAFT_329166 [Pyronema omphalodes]